MMTKYPQCRKRFGRHPYKQRYFRLTTQSLSYAKSKGKQPICDIPLVEIERVEQLNEKNFKMQNCFKVNFHIFTFNRKVLFFFCCSCWICTDSTQGRLTTDCTDSKLCGRT